MIFNQKFISMFNDSRKIQDLALTLAILFYIQTYINYLVNFLNLLKDIKIWAKKQNVSACFFKKKNVISD